LSPYLAPTQVLVVKEGSASPRQNPTLPRGLKRGEPICVKIFNRKGFCVPPAMSEAGPQGANTGACKWQGRLSRGTPTPPGYGHLTRHPPRKVTPTWGSHPATDKRGRTRKMKGKGVRLHATVTKCSGLGGRRKHTLQDNLILQARILTAKGSSSTLGVDNTFGEVRPGLGRRHGPRVSALKDNVITKPRPSPPGSSPRIRPEQAARPVTPGPRPAVLRGHQPDPRPRQVNSGVGPANGRPDQAPADQIFSSSQLCLCSR
jgi:hypothetical protein